MPIPSYLQTIPEQIRDLLDRSESQEHVYWGKELIISYRLPNGFIILGRTNGDELVGDRNPILGLLREEARMDALRQLWHLENYAQKAYADNRARILDEPTQTES